MSILSHVSRALVVEDDYLLATQMQDFLSAFGCEEVITASRVNTALHAVNVGVRFAVLDVSLGGEPCDHIARRLSADVIPFIYVSGYQQEHHPELPLAPWVAKPAIERNLLEAISSALNPPGKKLSALRSDYA
ncbi:hypothetical protein [Devosia sp. LjRoot3]|uniref:hypothetical protein n=1 Tax=Devosia sp. LjRoot3 TaxID=3342319 RepID=UPI003ECD51C3